MPVNRKSRREPALLPPLDFHPPSNGEFCPLPPSRRAMEALQRWLMIVEKNHRRLGMTRREFANSACGMAAALLAINQTACSSSKESGGTGGNNSMASNGGTCGLGDGCGGAMGDSTATGLGGGASTNSGSGGANVTSGSGGSSMGPGGSGMNTGGSSTGAGGSGTSSDAGGSGGAMAMDNGGAGGFMVTEDMTEDMNMAEEMMSGNEFIFDVQTHTSQEIEEPWDSIPPDERALAYISQIFVQSDTQVAVLSGPPHARGLGPGNVAARAQIGEIIDRIGGPRLLVHGNADPERGSAEIDYMGELIDEFSQMAAWKIYPHEGDLLLDSDELGVPFVEAARTLGLPMVAGHRGLWVGQNGDDGSYMANGSPRDMVATAAAAPDINFLIYHSGYERMNDENHGFDASAAEHFGVDRLLRALDENDLGPGDNVYAELGSTWANIMTEPEQAAHVIGKLLLALGPDNILWGTDCVYNGIPQSQITAFRMFQIPEQLQEEFGYPALTREIKEKIFGLNAARIYGVDVDATRTEISEDDVDALRTAFLHEPNHFPVPDRRRFEGPRTRRDFFKLLEYERTFKHG